MNKKVAVIGGGIAGMATALRLVARGCEVTIYEKNPYLGGKMASFDKDGFRFDMGPSLFTMPHLLDELFALVGEKREDALDVEQLDVVTQYFYPDDTQVIAYADVDKFKDELQRKLGEDRRNIDRFFAQCEAKYDITHKVFLEKSLHKTSTYLNIDTIKSFARLPQIHALQTMNGLNTSLLDNPKTVQLFNRYATYNGSNPYKAPATLNVIAHIEHQMGAFFPKKGMRAIADSLAQLLERVGVDVRLNTKIDELWHKDGKAKGVVIEEQPIPYDIVVSNEDVFGSYRSTLSSLPKPKITLSRPRSSSALIFFWGVDKEFPALSLHNIFFSTDYKEEFEQIFDKEVAPDDPTAYVYISSKIAKGDAPKGMENWFVMINVPPSKGQDWEREKKKVRAALLRRINHQFGVDMEKHIRVEECLTPDQIDQRTLSPGGALYGMSSNDMFAAFMRHPNFHSKMKGLYFCGGSVHPGGGIPLCLLSAKIVDDLVTKDYQMSHQ